MSSSIDAEFDWIDFLDLAKELIKNQKVGANQQAIFRTCIGRSYYAAFNMARHYISLNNPKFVLFERSRIDSSHELVLNEFYVEADPRKLLIRSKLNRLRNDRRKADYDRACSFELKQVLNRIHDAEDVIEDIGIML